MSSGQHKNQSRENRQIISRILMSVWDPIGVSEIPEAANEYDIYVGEVYSLLIGGNAQRRDIAEYLMAVAVQRMGLPYSADLTLRCDRTAEALVSLRSKFQVH